MYGFSLKGNWCDIPFEASAIDMPRPERLRSYWARTAYFEI